MKLIAFTALLAAASGLVLAKNSDPNNTTGTHGLVLIDKRGHEVRFFDPATHTELAHLDIGENPHELAISPDHKMVYVPVYGDGVYGRNPHPGHTIAEIDVATHKVIGTIDVSPYQAPHGIQVGPDGTIYVTCDLSRKLLVIDPKSRSIKAAIDTEGTGHWAVILPDASKAYIANKNDKPYISVIDLKARKVVARVPAPKGTQGIAASPDGKRVLAIDGGDPILIVIDTATDKVIDRVPLEDNARAAFRVRYSPDGKTVLTCNMGSRQVNILSAANLRGPQHVVTVGKDPMGFGFAPDGKTVLVANHGDGTVSILDLTTDRVTGNFMAGTGIETISYY
jgi:YVTN family beta-propeller protein